MSGKGLANGGAGALVGSVDAASVYLTGRIHRKAKRNRRVVVYVRSGYVYAVGMDSRAARELMQDDDRAARELIGVYTTAAAPDGIYADLVSWLVENLLERVG